MIYLKIRFSSFFLAALIFLALPVMVFFFGTVKFPVALVCSAVLGVSVFFAYKESLSSDPEITVSPASCIIIFAVSLVWVFFCGVSEYSWTTADHPYRAAILNDLIEYDWPVIYSLPDGQAAFAYYYAFWAVPAALGKIFGLGLARVVLLLQTSLGIWLTVIGLSFFRKKYTPYILAMVILFSTFDYIPLPLLDILHLYDGPFEGWNNALNIHCNTFQVMNVFNQSVPGWLIVSLMLNFKNGKQVGLMGGLMFCYSPWAVFGMIPFALYKLFPKVSDILTFRNIAFPGCALLVLTSYFTLGNSMTSCFTYEKYDNFALYLLSLLCFAVFEAGIWILLLYPRKKTAISYLGITRNFILVCIVLPLVYLTLYDLGGLANDLLLRGSMVPMFILTPLAAIKLEEIIASIKKAGSIGLPNAGKLLLYFITCLTPFMLLLASVTGTIQIYTTTGFDTNPDRYEIGSFGSLTGEKYEAYYDTIPVSFEYEDSFFFKYLSK